MLRMRNTRKVVHYEIVEGFPASESTFAILLDNNNIMEVDMVNFYLFMFAGDPKLEAYVLKFRNALHATYDLEDLEYDFLAAFNNYIQQYTDEQINRYSVNFLSMSGESL